MDNQKSNQNNSQNNSQNVSTRSVDREYYMNQETSRNKWFNYSDPYYLNNQEVQKYQDEVTKNQEQMQDLNQSNSQTKQDKMKQEMQSAETKMGSTTNYAYYAHGNQYPSNGIDPFDNTTTPEPIVDVESHVNLNTAPSYAGDHLYPSGYTRTEESGNTFAPTNNFVEEFNQEAIQRATTQANHDESCQNCHNKNQRQKDDQRHN